MRPTRIRDTVMKQSNVLNRFRVMETETILKNGSDAKSRTNSNNLLMSIQGGGRLTYSQMKNTVFLFAMILTLALVSCDKDPIDNLGTRETPPPKTEVEVFAQSEYNLALRDFTLVVGKAMKENAEFRKMLTNEALKRQPKYSGILFKDLVEQKLETSESGVSSVKELLNSTFTTSIANNGSIVLKSSFDDFVNSLLEQYPDWVIAITENAVDWDNEDYLPMIAFLPEEFMDGQPFAPGYDPNNDFEFVAIDAINEPETPILVFDSIFGITDEEIAKGVVVIPGYQNQLEALGPIETIPFDEGGGPPPETQAPPHPTYLGVVANQNGISLSWTKPTWTTQNQVRGYRIYRKKDSETEWTKQFNITQNNITGYTDISTDTGVWYNYAVRSYNWLNGITLSEESSNMVSIKGVGNPVKFVSFTAKATGSTSVKLDWAVSGDASLVDNFELDRKKSQSDDLTFYKEFAKTIREFNDNAGGYKKFDTVFYQMKAVTSTGGPQPSPIKDFVFLPERNPNHASGVRIRGVFVNTDITSTINLQGPRFCIKVVNVDRANANNTIEVCPQAYVEMGWQDKMSVKGGSKHYYKICNSHILDWSTNDWYDRLTFRVQRTRASGTNNFNVNGEFNIKNLSWDWGSLAVSLGSSLATSFTRKKVDEIGYRWYNYYEPVWKVLRFENYNFMIVLGDDTGQGMYDWPYHIYLEVLQYMASN